MIKIDTIWMLVSKDRKHIVYGIGPTAPDAWTNGIMILFGISMHDMPTLYESHKKTLKNDGWVAKKFSVMMSDRGNQIVEDEGEDAES